MQRGSRSGSSSSPGSQSCRLQFEWHKQLILLAIGAVQLFETRMLSYFPERGVSYVVMLKILLATALIDHTGEVGINSSYYPIYFLPVVTAALYCGPWLTLVWTFVASAAYCSYLYPAMQEYDLTPDAFGILALRVMFFFLAAMVVNRFSQQSRHQTQLYRELAERLADANHRLEQAQAEARRSERLAALGQLSAGLAHEIRNPLGVIKGSAEMLTQKLQASDELARELAGYISTEVNRLSALVTEFLDFARPLHAQPHPADLIALLDRVLDVVAARFAGKKVVVIRNYATGLPLVPLDESLCEQAFLNLVQNAYEAMLDEDPNETERGSERRPERRSETGWHASSRCPACYGERSRRERSRRSRTSPGRHRSRSSRQVARGNFQSVCYHEENRCRARAIHCL